MSDTSYEEQRPKAAEAGVPQPIRHVEHSTVPLDLDDPHRAALEDNPEHAEKLTLSTVLAVMVRAIQTERIDPC